MRIIWADHDPSCGVLNPSWNDPAREEVEAKELTVEKSSPSGITEEAAQEKSSWKEQRGFG